MLKPPVLAVVGRRHSGKTTLIEKLLVFLQRRGYRIAAIKHGVSEFQIDQPGKDTFRFQQAGAALVLISSPQKLALVKQTASQISFEEIYETYLQEYDLVISEGCRDLLAAKIEVVLPAAGNLYPETELLATVGPAANNLKTPYFDWNDIATLGEFIIAKLLGTN